MNNIIIIDKGQGAILINPANIILNTDGIDFYPAQGDCLHVKWLNDESKAELEYSRLCEELKAGKTCIEFESDF